MLNPSSATLLGHPEELSSVATTGAPRAQELLHLDFGRTVNDMVGGEEGAFDEAAEVDDVGRSDVLGDGVEEV